MSQQYELIFIDYRNHQLISAHLYIYSKNPFYENRSNMSNKFYHHFDKHILPLRLNLGVCAKENCCEWILFMKDKRCS